jgi:hypothetical protein
MCHVLGAVRTITATIASPALCFLENAGSIGRYQVKCFSCTRPVAHQTGRLGIFARCSGSACRAVSRGKLDT